MIKFLHRVATIMIKFSYLTKVSFRQSVLYTQYHDTDMNKILRHKKLIPNVQQNGTDE